MISMAEARRRHAVGTVRRRRRSYTCEFKQLGSRLREVGVVVCLPVCTE